MPTGAFLRTCRSTGFPVFTWLPEFHFADVFWLSRAWRKNICRYRDVAIGIIAGMPVRRGKRTMNGAVAKPQVPRFLLITTFTVDELNRPVGVLVGCIALDTFWFPAIFDDDLIVIVIRRIFGVFGPVPNDLVIPVASKPGVNSGMPLADVRGCVTVLAEDAWPERTLFWIVRAPRVLTLHSHRFDAVLVMSRQKRCSRWHTPGTDVSSVEPDSTSRKRVNVWRRYPFVAFRIATDGSMRLVIGVDEKDIRTFGKSCAARNRHQKLDSKKRFVHRLGCHY